MIVKDLKHVNLSKIAVDIFAEKLIAVFNLVKKIKRAMKLKLY